MADDILLRNDMGAVAELTMNAPKSMNALSEDMLAALKAELDALRTDNKIRAVILKGAGRAFCPGHNLKEMTQGRQGEDGGKSYFLNLFARCTEVMLGIRTLPQPVIAQPHGIATAAGCQLVATCDMAVADSDCKFGVNGVNIGLFCSTPMVALSRNIHTKKAFQMLTTGSFISAQEAVEYGLINSHAPADQLDEKTRELADLVASKLGAAVKVGKEAYYKQMEMPIADAYAYTGDVMAQNMMFRETEAGIAAFLDKRPHEWDQE